jgi:hypothetical protein
MRLHVLRHVDGEQQIDFCLTSSRWAIWCEAAIIFQSAGDRPYGIFCTVLRAPRVEMPGAFHQIYSGLPFEVNPLT